MGDRQPVSDQLFHILLSLVDQPRHGYGILQEVEARTDGGLVLGSGTLYSAIKRIRAWGWVVEVDAPQLGDPRRKYYGLTEVGRQVVQAEARRLETLVRHARAKHALPGSLGCCEDARSRSIACWPGPSCRPASARSTAGSWRRRWLPASQREGRAWGCSGRRAWN